MKPVILGLVFVSAAVLASAASAAEDWNVFSRSARTIYLADVGGVSTVGDDTTISRDYTLQIAGSRYFTEKAPIVDYNDLDRRMRNGELSLALEIPPGFGRDVARGTNVEIGA